VADERPAARAESWRVGAEKTDSMSALAIGSCGKGGAHLRPHTMKPPRFLPALGGNDAVGPNDLTDDGMVELAVELAVSQHTANGRYG
jgi:hypothetical protein